MIKEKINELLFDLSRKVNQAILERNFEKIIQSEHTITIKVFGETIDIWNANDPISTSCHTLRLSDYEYINFPDLKFRKPATCRNILRKESEQEKQDRERKIKEEIEKLQKQLN